MSIDRRTLLLTLATMTAANTLPLPTAYAEEEDFAHPFKRTSTLPEHIGLLLYPKMTILDVVGPYHFLCFMSGAKIHLITNQLDLRPVVSDAGMGVQPTMTMEDSPLDLDLLLVPGGTDGTVAAARDERTTAFLNDRGRRARFVSSVCTGSLVLGAAGLLNGRRATSHWSVVDRLSQFGAIPTHQRVVEDGHVITAAGVSAGLDLGVLLVNRLRGRPLAEAAVLATEYAPEPSLHGGTTSTARPQIVKAVTDGLRAFSEEAGTLRLLNTKQATG